MLNELPFYDKSNIVRTAKAIKRYSRSYSIAIVKDKDVNIDDPLAQLEASKPVIKDLFRDLPIEMMSFKYQIAMKLVLRNLKNWCREFAAVYFILQKQ